MKEIKSLTGLRGIAALYVIIMHIGFLENSNSIFSKHIYFINFIEHSYLAVDMFFILSGFVLMLIYNKQFKNGYNSDFKTFLIKRFIRIYPLYFACLIIYLVKELLSNTIHQYSYKDLFFNFVLLQSQIKGAVLIYPSWSLSTEMLSYLLFPLICYFALLSFKYKKSFYLFLLLAICIFFIGIPYSRNIYNTLFFQRTLNVCFGIGSLLRCIIGMLLGSMFFLQSQRKAIYKYQLPICLLIITVLCWTNYTYLCVLLFGFLVWSLAEDKGFIAKILSTSPIYKLGLWSYSIYLLHPIIIGPLRTFIYSNLKETIFLNWAFPISLAISLILTILFSFLTYTFIELPSKKILSNLMFKKKIIK